MAWKIMIVDDDADWINLLKFIAERWGHTCIGTTNPLKALEVAREQLPDVILLDDMMPGMDGVEVMQQIRADEATRRIPIWFSSAREANHFNHLLVPENEPIRFLGKPFNPSTLNTLLDEYLGTQDDKKDDSPADSTTDDTTGNKTDSTTDSTVDNITDNTTKNDDAS